MWLNKTIEFLVKVENFNSVTDFRIYGDKLDYQNSHVWGVGTQVYLTELPYTISNGEQTLFFGDNGENQELYEQITNKIYLIDVAPDDREPEQLPPDETTDFYNNEVILEVGNPGVVVEEDNENFIKEEMDVPESESEIVE